MIFSASKGMYTAVLLGEKTLTTRLKLPAHIAVGKEWAIVPKRASAAWWIGNEAGEWRICKYPHARVYTETTDVMPVSYVRRFFMERGYTQARVRIDAFWQTSLQCMSELEALEEGAGSVAEYAALWDSINDRKGGRWADNPLVWRIRVSVPQDVAQAVSRVGKQAILDAAKVSTP